MNGEPALGTPRNGGVSFWWEQVGLPAPRPRLSGSMDADVCVVGGGYTGLWTAYYVKRAAPDARVVVLEQRFAGFGASGRNGGWCTNSITGGRERYIATHGRDAAAAFQRAMNETVDEVIAVAAAEGIDADLVKGGELNVARTPSQLARLTSWYEDEAAWPETGIEQLDAQATSERIGVDGVLGATWQPYCARLHPAKLARGLAEAVVRAGVEVYEDTAVTEIVAGQARTDAGVVRAPAIVRATEGFTAALRGQHRRLLPMNSSMIVTEPLPTAVWERIGWRGGEVLGDFAHVYMYAQRTADDRIAFGGRGVPYRYGSRVDTDGTTQPRTIENLTALLREFFPAAAGVPIAHGWAGVLGVPRDWTASVGFDAASGLGWAGGYVGTGVATTNLAGRTLADLVVGRETELTGLPWVGRRVRDWEPEPLRWLAVQGIYAAYRTADRLERDGRTATAAIARIADAVAGR